MSISLTPKELDNFSHTLVTAAYRGICTCERSQWFLNATAPYRCTTVEHSTEIDVFEQQDCGICFESLAENEIVRLSCGHLMHRECAETAFKTRGSCPFCNQLARFKCLDCLICVKFVPIRGKPTYDVGALLRSSCCGFPVHAGCMERYRRTCNPMAPQLCLGCWKANTSLDPVVTS